MQAEEAETIILDYGNAQSKRGLFAIDIWRIAGVTLAVAYCGFSTLIYNCWINLLPYPGWLALLMLAGVILLLDSAVQFLREAARLVRLAMHWEGRAMTCAIWLAGQILRGVGSYYGYKIFEESFRMSM